MIQPLPPRRFHVCALAGILLAAIPVSGQTAPQPTAQPLPQPAPVVPASPISPAASGEQPAQVVIHSDHKLTHEEETKLKAKALAMRNLPLRSPLWPGFQLETPTGRKMTLKDLHGQVVLLDYWATWCAPCVEVLPQLDAVYQKYRSDPRVTILAVNPLRGDTPKSIRAFAVKMRLTVPMAFDRHYMQPEEIKTTDAPKSVATLPLVLLLDRDGKQQWMETGGTVGDPEYSFEKSRIAKIDAELAK